MQNSWIIYGANGYTGRLITAEAISRGLSPILAGRNRDLIEAMGKEFGLEVRVFSCASEAEISPNLNGVKLVLHCAGPFSATSLPMMDACLKMKVNYLDITGEIPVFEELFRRHDQFKQAGVVGLSGVGFDVVPSDCLAAMLKSAMPDAVSLTLAMKPSGGVSPGTLKTMIEGLGNGGMIRKEGALIEVPTAYRVRTIRFGEKVRIAVTIPWGDVSTAYHSTGIPNIEFYCATSSRGLRALKALRILKPVLGFRYVQTALKYFVDRQVKGPSQADREAGRSLLWGEAVNAAGKIVVLQLECPEGYQLTKESSVRAVEKVLSGGVPAGATTPSKAFGADFVQQLSGIRLETPRGE